MRMFRVAMLSVSMLLLCNLPGQSQIIATNTDVVVPPLVNFSGALTDVKGKPLTGTVGVTFLLYKEEQGGSPLWMETQNVQLDRTGHYTVMLGSTSSTGLPSDIFIAGEAHWLGVQVQGQEDQPRVLLVSAPYALKAGDAQTLGGLPVSAFLLAAPSITTAPAPTNGAVLQTPATGNTPVTTGGGTVNNVPLWDSTSDITSSVITQTGSGTTAKIGINTTTPATTLDVKGGSTVRGTLNLPANGTATATAGKNSQPQTFVASAFNSGTSMAVLQTFQWQAEPAGNNTSAPSGTMNLLFAQGTGKAAETGLHIANNGQITFATGQTFPGAGAGTITGVTAGTDLTGGGTSGSVTLNVDTTKIPQLGAGNTFVGNQSITGNLSASGSVTAQTGNFDGTSSTPLLNIVQTGTGDGGVITAATGYAGLLVTGSSIGVQGTANASGGTGLAGYSTNGYGVYAYDNATSGNGSGVFGGTASSNGIGVIGEQSSSAASGAGAGVSGATLSPNGFGVSGYQYATTGTTAAVFGLTSSAGGSGVEGANQGVSGKGGLFVGGPSSSALPYGGIGVVGAGGADQISSGGLAGTGGAFVGGNSATNAPGGGLYGLAGIGPNPDLSYVVAGVEGVGPFSSYSSTTTNGPGVLGSNNTFSTTAGEFVGTDIGVWGDTSGLFGIGVLATADDATALFAQDDSSTYSPVRAYNSSTSNAAPIFIGASGLGFAILGGGGCSNGNYIGLQLAQFGMANCTNYTMLGDGVDTFINAGNGSVTGSILFRVNNNSSPNAMSVNKDGSVSTGGNLSVGGTLSKKGGSFKIDHPLDPANKYLYHSFVESPDMMNIYNGVVALDGLGGAVVELPGYFGALNRDFRYQLTAIGAPGPNLYIAEEIQNNQFKIAGGAPGAKVSWQVTGIRQDVWANAHRIPVEVEKDLQDLGHYLSPELYGQPEEAGIGYGDPIPPQLPKHDSLVKRPKASHGAVPAVHGRMKLQRPTPPVLPKLPPPPKAPAVAKPQIAPAAKETKTEDRRTGARIEP
jgi:hypothetical protein